ncbi:MAG: PilZ domain-containing protein [Actinomycetales bacterium]
MTIRADDLPAVNALVRVAVKPEDLQGFPSRVEAVEHDPSHSAPRLVIAAPGFVGDLVTLVDGMPLLVRWTGSAGVFEVSGRLESVAAEGVKVWRVELVGDIRRTERRRYARASSSTPLRLVPLRDTPVVVLAGWVSDLSEGGLRGRVSGRVAPGERVRAHVTLDERQLQADGHVIDVREGDRHGELELVVRFEEPVREEDLIRRWVLRQQVLARRTMKEKV